MYKTLTLKNDFHNTSVNLRVEHDGEIEVGDVIHLTGSQVKRAKRELCVKDCICSGDTGARADWHQLGDKEVKLSIDINADRNWHITGATIAIEKIY
jgi:hypothetical protein